MSDKLKMPGAQELDKLSPEQKRALLERLLAQKAEQEKAKQTQAEQQINGQTSAKQNPYPLSFAQQRLWFIDQLEPGQSAYIIPAALQLDGPLNADLLKASLNQIIQRHEILRTRFVADNDGDPKQVIDPVLELVLPVEEALNTDQQSIATSLRTLATGGFDLATGPLLRAQLLHTGEHSHVLLLCIHHIIADYWSLRVLMREIALLYSTQSNKAQSDNTKADNTSVLPELKIQYLDYSVWQRDRQQQLDRELDYWTKQLDGMPTLLQLPTDFPRPSVQRFRGARHEFTLPATLSQQLRDFSKIQQSTLFATLLAALQTILFRYSGQSDFAIGTTSSNRNREELRDLIGLFVNNLVLRAQVSHQQAFGELLAQAQQTTLEALAHQEAPFERIVDSLDPERQLSHNALFQVMFVLHNTAVESIEMPGLAISALPIESNSTRFDLSLDMVDGGKALTGFFEYSTDLFSAQTIARLAAHLEIVLEAVVNDPALTIGAIPLLSDDERGMMASVNATEQAWPDRCVHRIIEEQVAATPDECALVFKNETLSYQELNQRANQLAHYLRQQGAQAGDAIALCLPRGSDLLVSLLAVMKIGGHYVPLDPSHPADRLCLILNDANIRLLLFADDHPITQLPQADWISVNIANARANIAQQAQDNLAQETDIESLCYLIYTSGSTGVPKGVPIRHRNLLNLLLSMAKAPGIQASDRLLAVTTIAFDIATLEMLLPLITGASLVIADEMTTTDGHALAQCLEDNDISLMQATPATWRLLLESGWQAKADFVSLCGGEALEALLAQQLLDAGCRLWNMYGPTETTIWSGALELTADTIADGNVPIGGPIANTGFYVLESGGQQAGLGVPGELCIGGEGLSPGYHQRAELTAERFIHHIDSQGHSRRLYRTGDRVSWREDGTLLFRGRLDHQLKLRGYRIEPGEIEKILIDHPSVSTALVVLDEARQRLIAYCEKNPDTDIQQTTLIDYLFEHLPAYMVPAACVVVERMPLNPNGKIDRKALEALALNTADDTITQALETDTEQHLATIWSDLLGLEIEDANANFFTSGGHSLLAARMASRIRAELGIELPVRAIFEHPRLSDLAARIDQSSDKAGAIEIQTRPADAEPVLSHAQHRQWVLASLEPDNPFYNIPAAVSFQQKIDPELLQQALGIIVGRHDVLHTAYAGGNFSEYGEGRGKPQVELKEPVAPVLDCRKLDTSSLDNIEPALYTLLRKAALETFDLAQAPLLRALYIDAGEDAQVVMLVLHHIAGDAWSLKTLFDELIKVYALLARQLPPSLPELRLSYLDYAHWEQQRDNEQSLSYWQQQLMGVPPLLDLPTDFPRPAKQGHEAKEVRFQIEADQRAALESLAEAHGASAFMILLAAFNALLHRFSACDDIVIGCPTGHRPSPDLDGIVGLFVNTLAIRSQPQADLPFVQLLKAVRETVLDGFAHQDAPFEQVINQLDLPRSWGHSPLFQVMFLFQVDEQQTGATAKEHNRPWSPLAIPVTTTKVDLTLAISNDDKGRFLGRLEYREDLFQPATMEALAEAFVVMLDGITQTPEQAIGALPLLSPKRQAELKQWNATEAPYPTSPLLHARFEAQSALTPDSAALIVGDKTLTYAELNARANQVAALLIEQGIGPEDRVGVCLRRNTELIVSILAVLKAGAAYVPLDPDYPLERIHFIIEDAQLGILLTESALLDQMKGHQSQSVCVDTLQHEADVITEQNPPRRAGPDNTAYIIYTSGSTGRPKGVTIEHRSPNTLIDWTLSEYDPARLAGVLASTSVCFDLSVYEIFVTLSCGGCLIMADNALALSDLPAAKQVTLINTVPTAAAELVRSKAIPENVTTVNVAGEPLSSALVRGLYASAAIDRVYNLYGPSEDTTYSTWALLNPEEPAAFAPIGRPIANTQAYVLDSQLQPVAPGFPGELYLAGDGVARGYWNRPHLTAERFIPDPFADKNQSATHNSREPMMYMTGDRVRLRHDGELAFLGRLDHQVKLRGFRIELGEIEAVLEQHPSVQQATLKVWQPEGSIDQLLAYLVLSDSNDPSIEQRVNGNLLPPSSTLGEALRQFVADSLPQYMVPAQFMILDSMPLLPNGKVARNALPQPELSRAEQGKSSGINTPMSDTEQQIAQFWQELLQVESISPRDNFFALGGDSILALQLVALARQNALALSPRDIFQYPTVSALARLADERDAPLVAPESVTGEVRLSPIQQWFFELPLQHPAHWNQAVLLKVDRSLNHEHLHNALSLLAQRHDALRSTFEQNGNADGWVRMITESIVKIPLEIITCSDTELEYEIQATASRLQKGVDLTDGPLWSVAYIEHTVTDNENTPETECRLLFICHHLLVDGVSWRILLSDLQSLLMQYGRQGQATLMPASTPLSHWVDFLDSHYQQPSPQDSADLAHWQQVDQAPVPPLPLDHPEGLNRMSENDTVTAELDSEATRQLLVELHDAHRVEVEELLVTALSRTLAGWHQQTTVRIELESHGRPDLDANIDLSRTVGWLTSLYPVDIETDSDDADRAIKLTRTAMGKPQHKGLGYGVQRFLLNGEDGKNKAVSSGVRFNYLGQADQLFPPQSWFAPASEAIGALRHPEDERGLVFDINAIVSGGQMKLYWGYSQGLHHRATVEKLAADWLAQIQTLLAHCLNDSQDAGYVAEDFPQMDFAPGELDDLLQDIE